MPTRYCGNVQPVAARQPVERADGIVVEKEARECIKIVIDQAPLAGSLRQCVPKNLSKGQPDDSQSPRLGLETHLREIFRNVGGYHDAIA